MGYDRKSRRATPDTPRDSPLNAAVNLRDQETIEMVASAVSKRNVLLAYNILQRIFFQHDFWRLIFASLTIRGSEAADHVKQMGKAANSLGEGLADGLDVAGF